jgi:hypothetical protein
MTTVAAGIGDSLIPEGSVRPLAGKQKIGHRFHRKTQISEKKRNPSHGSVRMLQVLSTNNG